jgi:hypothetical protein
MTWEYWVLVVGLIVGGGLLFFVLAKSGEKIIERNNLKLFNSPTERNLFGYDNKAVISMTDLRPPSSE